MLDGSGVSVQGDGSTEAAYRRRPRRLPRPPRARARAYAPGRSRGPRRPRIRRAALRGEHAAASRRRVVARPDVGARGGARGPPVEAGGCRRAAGGRRARRAPVAHRERSRTSSRSVARARPSRAPCETSGGQRDRIKTGTQAVRGPARQAAQPAALPQRRGGDLRGDSRAREPSSCGRISRHGGEREEHAVRRGSVVARPAGTGRAHTFRAGDERALRARVRDPRPA